MFVTVSEAARRLDLSPRRVRELVADGTIEAVSLPALHLISPGEVERVAQERAAEKRARRARPTL